MSNCVLVPNSCRSAGAHLRQAVGKPLDSLSRRDFVRAWCAIAYLYPGLHPEGYASPDSGWPRVLKPFATEAWRRCRAGELDDEEMFACDAQWAGLFDRFIAFTPDEYERRLQIAAEHGESAEAA